MRQLGLTARLTVALAAVAIFSVGLAALLSNWRLESQLSDHARNRLDAAAKHSATLAASLYRERGRWNLDIVRDLKHSAQVGGFAAAVYSRNDKVLPGSEADTVSRATEKARAPVTVNGRNVGSIVIAPGNGKLLTAADRDLSRSLNRLHVLAAALAAALGLMLGIIIAVSLAKPLRRLTDASLQMAKGDLSVRVNRGGGAEIEQLGSALGELANSLQQEEAVRKKTVADIKHELRTPLASIVSRIEAAQDGVLDDEQRNLQALHTEALRLTSLIDDLERLAEADQPKLFVAKEPVDLAEIARGRAETYADYFTAKDVSFHQELESVQISGDARRLDQIVDNLLSNALRYTLPEGRVTMRVEVRNDCAVLEVIDTGIGIAPEERGQIFKRFWRGEKARKLATGGAGVGLAVTRELVSVHDGHIEFDSKPGQGSTFRVILPVIV